MFRELSRLKKIGILLSIIPFSLFAIFMAFQKIYSIENDTLISEISMKPNQEMKWWESQGVLVTLTDFTSNIFIEDLLKETGYTNVIPVNSVNQNSSITLIRQSGITLTMDLRNIQLYSKYEDVEHLENDNDYILHAKSPSVAADLQKPLINIINHFCREPLPDHYFLTMTPYYNRYTRGNKIICNKNQMTTGSIRCPDHYYNGQIYAYRTVNDQCTHNKAIYLPQDTDSFYCTQNSPLLNTLFREKITEKIELQSFGECLRNRQDCEKCFRPRCNRQFKSLESGNYKNCCQLIAQCLLQPSCIDYYSPSCYYVDLAEHQHSLCIKGSTYQFTLNPQFSLNNNSFMCHIKMSNDQSFYEIHLKLSVPHWMKVGFQFSEKITKLNSHKVKSSPFETYEYHSNLMNIFHSFKSSTLFKDSILLFKSGKYRLFKLKTKFSQNKPIVEKHFHIKYTKLQASNPFAINTKNWLKRSCYTTIDDLYENQTIYNEKYNHTVNLIKLEKGTDSSFQYFLESDNEPYQINISINGKTSLLKSAVCGKFDPNSRSNLSELKISFNLKSQFNWTWNLEIKGEIENSYEYLNIQLKEKSKSNIIFNKDVLIIRLPVTEKNQFSINHSLQFFPESFSSLRKFRLVLIVSDCHQSIQFKMYIEPKNEDVLSSLTLNGTETFMFNNQLLRNAFLYPILWKLSLTFIVLAVLIFLLVLINVFIKLQNLYFKSFLKIKCKTCSWNVKSEKKRKFVIIIYITLRIIYTFIFTSTCIISMILTINLNSMIKTSPNSESTILNRNPRGFRLRIEKYNENCDSITKLQIKKTINIIFENKNHTINSWYQSKISLPAISADFYQMNSSKIKQKIHKYLQQKIMNNIKLRLADQTGPMREIVDETVKLKWLNIISSWSTEKRNLNFNILPIFTNTQAQNLILSKLNESAYNLLENENLLSISKWNVKTFYRNRNDEKIIRYFGSSKKENVLFMKNHKLKQSKENWKIFFNGNRFSLIKIRISLLILDLLLILFRCYHIYRDFQIIWFGSEKLLPYPYFVQISEDQSNACNEQYMFERKELSSRLATNMSKKSFVLSSLEKLKLFRNNYYITLVIFCGLSMITIFIFIVLQSSQITVWIRSVFSLQTKSVPAHYFDRLQRQIISIFAVYNKKRKHQLELEFQLSSNNQRLLFRQFHHHQKYEQNFHSFELCAILRVFSDSKNNQILKMKMQSQFLFIPLQIVEECLSNETSSNFASQFHHQSCHLSNSTIKITSDQINQNFRQKEMDLMIILKIRNFLLILTSVFLITVLCLNLLKIILQTKNCILEQKISVVKILYFQSNFLNDSVCPNNITPSSYPLLRSYNSDDHDPYFTIDSRSPKKYLLIRLNDNRETDI